MKTIDVIVQKDGKTQVETRGFSGRDCFDASRFLEAALGTCSAARTTVEFHQSRQQTADESVEDLGARSSVDPSAKSR
jgi:hypothetical protein